MTNGLVILPLVLYLILMLAVAWFVTKRNKSKNGFVEEYFIGGRSMGGFVLGMTLIATFVSASSFIGGPGVAYSTGLSWVLLAMIQVPTAFLTLGVLGKKFAIISRRINAVTVTDYLYARYKSNAVVVIASIALVLFFVAMMVSQFIGGGVLFQNITGYSYLVGLILFGIVVVLYTTIGGFRAVALTDAIQAMVMVAATIVILVAVINQGGGVSSIVDTITETNPSMVDPNATAKPTILSYWILVGIGVLGLPQTSVRCMGFKNTKSLNSSMIIGTIVVGFLLLGMHLVGFLSAGVLEATPETSDSVIPMVVLQELPSFWAGLFLAGPLAAVMSTVSSLLLLASASVIKDIMLRYSKKSYTQGQVKKYSWAVTAILGILAFVFAIEPPDLIVWVNLFAMGGLEAAFFWPTLLGLYWKRANKTGVISGIIGGVGTFLLMGQMGWTVIGMNNIVIALLVSLVFFIVGTYLGKKPDSETIELFFG